MSRSSSYRLHSQWIAGVVMLTVSALGTACATDRRSIMTPSINPGWETWQILETRTGRVIAFDEWLVQLAKSEIVYVGEEHHNQHHITAAVKILNGLMTAGFRPVIGMEMFGWDGQTALNNYLESDARDRQRDAFLEQVRWKQNWGGPFEDYEPLVAFAGDRHLSLLAMNPPKSLIRQVAKEGLAQARQGAEWTRWGMQGEDIVDDPAYHTRIVDQLRRCHGGGTDDDYRTMYEASMVRDEGMAKTLAAALEDLRRDSQVSKRIVLSYTGGGHIQYNLPVPNRVARRFSGQDRSATVYLTSYDSARADEIQELLRDGIADYVWLTPLGQHGPPQRCR